MLRIFSVTKWPLHFLEKAGWHVEEPENRVKKLWIVVFVAILSSLIITALLLFNLRSNLFDAKLELTKNVVEVAQTSAHNTIKAWQDGTLTEEEAKERVLATINGIRFENGANYMFVFDFSGHAIMHPINPALNGKNLTNGTDANGFKVFDALAKTGRDGGGVVEYVWEKPGSDVPVAKISYILPINAWDWAVAAGVYTDDVDAIFYRQLLAKGMIDVIVIAVLVFVSLMIARSISGPIITLTERTKRLADGDRSVDIPDNDRRDEIGSITQAIHVFKDNLIRADKLAEEQEIARAIRERRSKQVMELTSGFDSEVGSILDTVSGASFKFESTAQSLASMSEEVGMRLGTVSSASEEASTNVQTVASAATELSVSITEISRQVQHSNTIALNAVDKVRQSDTQASNLATATQRIGEVVSLINDIANQTNLLALNATIEAARAGESGKGFAVVAHEVKNLANQTANATEEIGSQIATVQSESKLVVDAIREIGDVIKEVNAISNSIATSVDEQKSATSEIAENVELAAAGTQEVSANVQALIQSSDETGNASKEVLEAASALAKNSEILKSIVDRFLSRMKSV